MIFLFGLVFFAVLFVLLYFSLRGVGGRLCFVSIG